MDPLADDRRDHRGREISSLVAYLGQAAGPGPLQPEKPLRRSAGRLAGGIHSMATRSARSTWFGPRPTATAADSALRARGAGVAAFRLLMPGPRALAA